MMIALRLRGPEVHVTTKIPVRLTGEDFLLIMRLNLRNRFGSNGLRLHQFHIGSRLVGDGNAAALFAHDAGVERNFLIEQEAKKQANVRRVKLQRIVILRGCFLDFGELVPGNGRKIMVLVVETYVQVRAVQAAVVAVRFLLRVEGEVVFLNPARAQRVESLLRKTNTAA